MATEIDYGVERSRRTGQALRVGYGAGPNVGRAFGRFRRQRTPQEAAVSRLDGSLKLRNRTEDQRRTWINQLRNTPQFPSLNSEVLASALVMASELGLDARSDTEPYLDRLVPGPAFDRALNNAVTRLRTARAPAEAATTTTTTTTTTTSLTTAITTSLATEPTVSGEELDIQNKQAIFRYLRFILSVREVERLQFLKALQTALA